MEIPKTYSPQQTEAKWYAFWLEHNFFKSIPDDREPYTIVIPPPNVTGVLHMGHMLNNTLQDVLIRRARMLGKNACWVPGTDHASIATEAKVVNMLKDKGIKKSDLTRDEFLTYAWEWKEKYGGIILEQLKQLGASCDWDRTRFTMENSLSEAVIDVFIDLHKKGHIYRGHRMVNWDPAGLTAVSDEEVIHKEVNSKLYYVKYLVEGTEEYLTIATTRPETILGDSAVCVHPEDPRYFHLHHKKVIVPLVNRIVPIITDDYVDMAFGTGVLKVTPAHDINDYALGQKHQLEIIDIFTPDGKINSTVNFYVGEDRFAVRKKIVLDLEHIGSVHKIEEIKNKVGYSERTNAVIEPRLSLQWFLKMEEISKPALENVLNGEVSLIPEKFNNTYKHWMENVRDWCISRQLWWGQRIPAWYDEQGNCAVAKTFEEASEQLHSKNIKQDEDVLDTWFSSWLWPISVFDGFKDPNNPDINYYYPTQDLITAPEILFFWVARMIIAGYEYRGKKPFNNVYLTGIVRDKQGRKMSKSLGNSPDPLDLIKMYGADGVRVGMLLSSPAGNDLLFDESSCEQGRNFTNKIWNAFRLIKGWQVDAHLEQNIDRKIASEWFHERFQQQLHNINEGYDKYRISEVLMLSYKLIWDDFCAHYLEMIKPEFVDGTSLPIDEKTYQQTICYFENLLKVIHPFTPFIAEELWHLIKERNLKDCIVVAPWPVLSPVENKRQIGFDFIQSTLIAVRTIRNEKNISPKEKLTLFTQKPIFPHWEEWTGILKKLAGLNQVTIGEGSQENCYNFIIGDTSCYIPMQGIVDIKAERLKLIKDLEYYKGFLHTVNQKLNNPGFISKANPTLIEIEQKKKKDAQSKIEAIERQLNINQPSE